VGQQQAKHATPSLALAAVQSSQAKWMHSSYLSPLILAEWVTWPNTFALTQVLQHVQCNVLSKTTWPSVLSMQAMVASSQFL
jgi:hypothetical protein